MYLFLPWIVNLIDTFLGKPTFLPCNTTLSARVGTGKFEITCGFRSRPMYEMTRWFAETTGQSIENESSDDGLQATVMVSC